MQYITFTQLRSKSKELSKALEEGEEIRLIRRSAVVGRIIPHKERTIKTIDSEKLDNKINNLRFPRLTLKEIDRRYRAAMMQKHGKGISRR